MKTKEKQILMRNLLKIKEVRGQVIN